MEKTAIRRLAMGRKAKEAKSSCFFSPVEYEGRSTSLFLETPSPLFYFSNHYEIRARSTEYDEAASQVVEW